MSRLFWFENHLITGHAAYRQLQALAAVWFLARIIRGYFGLVLD